MERVKQAVPLALILALAAGLRIACLGWGLPNQYHVTTYNCDEYTALSSLEGMQPSKLNFNPVNKNRPYALNEGTFNLYTYGALLKILSLPGIIKLTPDKNFYYENIGEWRKFFLAGRGLSLAYGLLGVWMLYFLAARAYGRRTALLAALFLALAPTHVVHSAFLIMNVPGVFWIILAFYFLLKISEEGSTGDYALAGAAIGLAASTRLSAGPLFLLLPLAHLLRKAPASELRKPALGLLLVGVFFLAGTPYALLDYPDFLKGLQSVRDTVAGGGLGPAARAAAVLAAFNEALGPLLLLLSLAGAAFAARKREKADILQLAWILLLWAAFFKAGQGATAGRILPAVPFMLLLGARALDALWTSRPAAAKTALALTAGLFLLFYCAQFRLVLGLDLRDEASAWMIAGIKPGSSIGLVKEPSWFSPGLIDRKYRHPDHRSLPDYRYVPLTAGKWETYPGYELLAAKRPDFVVISSIESGLLPGPGLRNSLDAAGYVPVKEFRREFSAFGLRLARSVPGMLYIPDLITVYGRTAPAKGS